MTIAFIPVKCFDTVHCCRNTFVASACRIEELRWAVNKLMEVANRLRLKRTQKGAVELEGVEVQVQLTDNKSSIEDLIPKQVASTDTESIDQFSKKAQHLTCVQNFLP